MTVRPTLALLFLLLAAPAGAQAATADIAVQMSGPQFAAVGVDTSYDVTILNRGPSPTAEVTLSDDIPSGARFVRTVAGDADCLVKHLRRVVRRHCVGGGRGVVRLAECGGEPPVGAVVEVGRVVERGLDAQRLLAQFLEHGALGQEAGPVDGVAVARLP